MRKRFCLARIILLIFFLPTLLPAQKKLLDHTVYDVWQSVNENMISNNGKWIVYSINPQEGDGSLFIQSAEGDYKQEIPRGYQPVITNDSRFVIFKIRPLFAESREAKIKKKKKDEMPGDSLGVIELGNAGIIKFGGVKSFKTPQNGSGWLAIQLKAEPAKTTTAGNKTIDSLKKQIDSLSHIISGLRNMVSTASGQSSFIADTLEKTEESDTAGTKLILYNLSERRRTDFGNVLDYEMDKNGHFLVLSVSGMIRDTLNNGGVLLHDMGLNKTDTILRRINQPRHFSFSDDGGQLAFVAETETDKKALLHFYQLYYYRTGQNTALKVADRFTPGLPENYGISGNGEVRFSKNGNRLFFGTSPIPMLKDTSLADIDLVKLDIWNYQDDYLQPQQLVNRDRDVKKSYLAMYLTKSGRVIQLGDEGLPDVDTPAEGDADHFVALTDTGRRIAFQWTGKTLQDIYWIDAHTGAKQLIRKNADGRYFPSPAGKYLLWYDNQHQNYFCYNGKEWINITGDIPVPLYDELNDAPDDPRPYGIMGWLKGDEAVYIYDRYDVWKVDPGGRSKPVNITGDGRSTHQVYRYRRTDSQEKFLLKNQSVLFDVFNDLDKSAGLAEAKLSNTLKFKFISAGGFWFGSPQKASDVPVFIYTKENYIQSPDLYLSDGHEKQLTAINPQQAEYNWGTAELFHWTTFSEKPATGILYKPEDFDSTGKYPVILYFYERLSDGLNRYIPPTPTPSRLNISFFVSRGYVVLAPDIAYEIGHPGQSAYDYIVSGAQTLAKKPWIDAERMGIQGQSWGGYQVAYLITRTNLFKAAWSGAPVANMFSAYGGIRWASGMNRQFQYEKTQSRIGATIWDRPELYIENSPLFHLRKVSTPLVIMANDADGAVPWYQGIELFTAMRRLGKPVWMLNYNGEAHNLVERKNRKDISIREQQFFDWLLKDGKPPHWITTGVPAVDKGKDWGLKED